MAANPNCGAMRVHPSSVLILCSEHTRKGGTNEPRVHECRRGGEISLFITLGVSG